MLANAKHRIRRRLRIGSDLFAEYTPEPHRPRVRLPNPHAIGKLIAEHSVRRKLEKCALKQCLGGWVATGKAAASRRAPKSAEAVRAWGARLRRVLRPYADEGEMRYKNAEKRDRDVRS
jgi:hypothetical protein